MGGKATSEFTRRYQREEYFDLVKELLPMVSNIFATKAHVIRAYDTKESFGDMDILLFNNGSLGNIKEVIQKSFNPQKIVCNGNCYSFDYKELQIDLISTIPENWETSIIFFAFNDLGNLMGKIAHKFGLKYGFNGLVFIYRIDDKRLGEITISKDMKKAWEFLGFDPQKLSTGFSTLEDIFKFVIDSPYFNVDSFQYENLNHINKARNKKRKVYNEFLQYLKDNDIQKRHPWNDDKKSYYKQIDEFFPECKFLEKIKEFESLEKTRREISEKFNGHLIMEHYPELQGKELGEVIKEFKESREKANACTWDEYVLSYNQIQILGEFANFMWTRWINI